MGVFFVLLLVPVMIQHFTVRGYRLNYKEKNKRALTFFFFFLTLLVMFRHESIGNDTRNYMLFFNKFAKMDWGDLRKDSLEIGFSYFNKIISMFSREPRFFLALSAIITVFMIYPTYMRLCVDTSLTIVLFCTMSMFVMMFSGIRQMLAVGLGVIAYEFTRKKKIISFILVVCLALTFHSSAFMLCFMYPLYHSRITKKWLYVVIPALVVVFIFNKQLFTLMGLFLERYTRYDSSMTQTGAYTMLVLFVVFTVFAFLIPQDSLLDSETIGLRNFLLISLVIQMFAPLHMLAMRMNYYYIIFIPLLLPKIVEYRSKRWAKVAIVGRHIMVVVLGIYFFLNAKNGGNLRVFPYHFFWENI